MAICSRVAVDSGKSAIAILGGMTIDCWMILPVGVTVRSGMTVRSEMTVRSGMTICSNMTVLGRGTVRKTWPFHDHHLENNTRTKCASNDVLFATWLTPEGIQDAYDGRAGAIAVLHVHFVA